MKILIPFTKMYEALTIGFVNDFKARATLDYTLLSRDFVNTREESFFT